MPKHIKLISSEYLDTYSLRCDLESDTLRTIRLKSDFTDEDFNYYIIASSLYSSKIEGNTLDVNSFFRNQNRKNSPQKKEVQEVQDLVKAYQFASQTNLNKTNFLKAHGLLSNTLPIPAKAKGKIRKVQVGIRDGVTMRPVYLAVEPEFVREELSKLFADIAELLKRDLSYKKVFYYASMIHLWCAKIHPFEDGNGRAARLLEKWFLASTLGISAWSIPSEKYYWDHRPEYYENIALGYNYYVLYWERCMPFLLMLPQSLKEHHLQ
jgi:Fic family protein